FWKPVLLFGGTPRWSGDVIKSNGGDKVFHQWGQSLSGMMNLLDALTEPGQLICDPFAGAGTTGVACKVLGRRFIGCDGDLEHGEAGRNRILLAKPREGGPDEAA